jgi:hypothetical protein
VSWYNPKDADKPVLPEGEYEAVIEHAEHKFSKANKPMCVVKLRVYGDTEIIVYEYLTGEMAWKVKKLAKAVGKDAEFEAGLFDPVNCIGMNLRVELKIQQDDAYGDKNKVGKFLPSSASVPAKDAPRKPVTPGPGEIDVPF